MIADRLSRRGPFAAASVLALSMMLFFSAPASAYDAPDVARLSRIVDETFMLGKDDVEWSYAEPNLVVEKGDLLQTNETGMAEIQFDGGLGLRIGEGSRVAFVEMGEEKVVGIDSGRAFLRLTRELSGNETFVLTFPSGRLSAMDRVMARLDVLEDGGAELRVIRGEIELATESGAARTITAGKSASVTLSGYIKVKPLRIARRDDFDAWNERLDIAMSTYRRPEYIEEEIVGSEDLKDYGEWVYSDNYGMHAWRPYVVEEWKPYSYGRWSYGSYYGWTWIPEEPWGYVTHHYGSWDYNPHYGWIWIPGYEWRPAHVHFVAYDDYIGWVPLGYYGYPVITTYPYYVIDPYIDFVDSVTFTFVITHHFHHRHDRHGHHRRNHRKHRDRDGKLAAGDEGRTLDFNKIKNGKLRFIKNAKNLHLKKNLRKGSEIRRKINRGKMLDLANHPRLSKKVAKLSENRRWRGKIRTGSVSANLPKKTATDRVETLDFRKGDRKRSRRIAQDRGIRLPDNGKRALKVSRDRKAVSTKHKAGLGTDRRAGANRIDRVSPNRSKKPEPARRTDSMPQHRRQRMALKNLKDRKREERTRSIRLADRPAVTRRVSRIRDTGTRGDETRRERERLSDSSKARFRRNVEQPQKERSSASRKFSGIKRNDTQRMEPPSKVTQRPRRSGRGKTVERTDTPARADLSRPLRSFQQRNAQPSRAQRITRQPSASRKAPSQVSGGRTFSGARSFSPDRAGFSGTRTMRDNIRSRGHRR